MSLEHKAFVFDYNWFSQELASILYNGLSRNDNSNLINFINNNLLYLKHPDEGEPLDYSWQDMMEIDDISEYGDVALTKYYDPQYDIGLGYEWEQINDLLMRELQLDISPLLGLPFGASKSYFDPGKLGSYFQSVEQVQENLDLLEIIENNKPEFLSKITIAKAMLIKSVKTGLYVTF